MKTINCTLLTFLLLTSCTRHSTVTITNLVKSNSGSVGTGTTPQPGVAKVVPQVIGVEQYLAQLKKVYFIEGNENLAFSSISMKWRGFWGGGCDFYGTVLNSGSSTNLDDPTQNCDQVTTLGPTGGFSVIKEGARINACEFFSDNDGHLDAFFRKGIVPDQQFNKSNAEKAFKLFYPQYDFTDAIYNNFIDSSNLAYPAIANDSRLRWRLFLSTLCQSLYWEIP
jgi:hypothetical protein